MLLAVFLCVFTTINHHLSSQNTMLQITLIPVCVSKAFQVFGCEWQCAAETFVNSTGIKQQ